METPGDAVIARLSNFLESNWSEEFSESLTEEQDAALGFALARAVHKGWVQVSGAVEPNLQAAEEFMHASGRNP